MKGSANVEVYLGALRQPYQAAVTRAKDARLIERLWERDATVFGKTGAALASVKSRLGWLTNSSRMATEVADLTAFATQAIEAGTKHIVLLGMGGSSLAPEVFRLIFGRKPGLVSFDVVDSTDPQTISRVTKSIDPAKTLFIVASKSGKTIETLSHARYFLSVAEKAKIKNSGERFVAITDSGSDLEKFAKEKHFARVFLNPADIGGRYSALSYFGLMAAALSGVRLPALVGSAAFAEETLSIPDYDKNSALRIGTLWGVGAEKGVDKLTFVTSPSLRPFVPWVEQLVAESTGKEGKGLIPIDAEPVGAFSEYGSDRLFMFLELAGENDAAMTRLFEAARSSAAPCVYIRFTKTETIGFEMMRMMMATAVAGFHMDINPFDEPNVKESKDNTAALLTEYDKGKAPKEPKKVAQFDNVTILALGVASEFGVDETAAPERLLKRYFTAIQRSSYVAILNYCDMTPEVERSLARWRRVIRMKLGVATLRGYGPRYLHSIGQLYKGGPGSGFFVSILGEDRENVAIPDANYSFGQLKLAQALGDTQALVKRHLPTLTLRISGDYAAGIDFLTETMDRAFKNLREERRAEVDEDESESAAVMSANESE